ncbi:MAG: hypothetical protein A2506_04820 [Elusimicrobia bacterium RIFOXYD12_FULL_66_9]|nr:MAG: hypothetical protein A2506_04820 [Elusimicrobia bacterium RIFOXYD12_FULL_66_9]
MRNALFALAVLAPILAHADNRGHRPYSLMNGRASRASAPASAPKTSVAAVTTSAQRGVSSPQTSYTGGSRSAVGMRASGGRPQGHKSFWPGQRKADGGETTTTTTEDPPPYFSKPGAFIRTEGQQPKYAEATPARAHTVEGGSFVGINNNKAQDVGRASGLRWGPKDTPPSPNPGSGSSASGNTSITPNSTSNTTNNNTTINGNQNGGSGNGNGNNNGFGGGTGFDPAF